MEKSEKKNKNSPLILIILDGWGIAPASKGNAISMANTPVMDRLAKDYPYTELFAHGEHVGLPKGQVGNSEAGHLNIGAGRIVFQDNARIDKAIADGTFFRNPAFLGAVRHVKHLKSNIHLMGLLSERQSPHSDPDHLYALLDFLEAEGIKKVYIHFFTDGRDSPKYASKELLKKFAEKYAKRCEIATVMGRFYAMDRKKTWERTEMAYNALVLREGKKFNNAAEAVDAAHKEGRSDEFIEPCIIENGGEESKIKSDDSVIFFNLRSDRARQLSKTFVQHDFNKMNPSSFHRKKKLERIYFVALTDFGPDLDNIITAFPDIDLINTLPVVLRDKKQLYIAESEKYAHVTYFFNGGYPDIVAGEKRMVVPSPDVGFYDMVPALSSEKLTNTVIGELKKDKFDFITLNFAAPDMIGHTGNLGAGIVCCEAVDKFVGILTREYLAKSGTLVITADHGNIESMINLETGEIITEHTTNKVPFIIVNNALKRKIGLRKSGVLGDIAPTILELLGMEQPEEMKGQSLIA